MLIRLLEARPNIGVARRALLIDLDGFARDQAVRAVLVNRMARGATHLILRMTAVEPSDMSALILMTGEAQAIGLGRLQFRWLPDVGRSRRFRMLASGTVAGFARLRRPAALLVRLHRLMRILLEGVEDVLMAHLAGLRPNVVRWLVLSRRSNRNH